MVSVIHFRGWLLMGSVLIILFMITVIPLGYISNSNARTVYVAVVAPVAWLLYVFLFYLIIYRPLIQCTATYEEDVSCRTRDGITSSLFTTREMHKLNRSVAALVRATEDLKTTTAALARGARGPDGEAPD